MPKINSYRDLIIWQKSMEFVTDIFAITRSFPKEELYGQTNQMRRCSVSIPTHIAKGYGRSSTGDYKRFLQVAIGSLYELQTQIEIAVNLKYIDAQLFEGLFEKTKELDRMLFSLTRKIN